MAALTQKVIGFRQWGMDVEETAIHGIGVHNYWVPGVNTARCTTSEWRFSASPYDPGSQIHRAPKHDAPAPDCHCGIYALHAAPEIWWNPIAQGAICGAIQAWGRIEVHRKGFRAEFAEPVVLAYDELWKPSRVERVKAIADRYGCAAVPMHRFKEAVACHGEPIAEALWPEAPEPDATPSPSTMLQAYEQMLNKQIAAIGHQARVPIKKKKGLFR